MGSPSLLTVLVALLCFAETGCVYSETPMEIAADSNSAFDTALLGSWRSEVDKVWGNVSEIRFERTGSESAGFIIDESSSEARRVRLIHLDGVSFFEASLGGKNSQKMTYYIGRVRREGDRLTIDGLDPEFFRKNPDSLASKADIMNSVKIIATTAAIRDFVRRNAKNDSAWEMGKTTYRKVPILPSSQVSGNREPADPR